MAKELKEVLVSVRNMEVTFGSKRNKFVAVHGVSFDIYKGETFGLVGESGSGKTTIGRAIIRINPMSDGEVIYKGQKINGKISRELDKQVTQQIQMIFQDPMASLNERAKVDYIVSEGLMNIHPEMSKEERTQKVSQALLEVGLLPEFASRFPHEFSGGQRQRIGIARSLIMEPEFIIAVIHKGVIVELAEAEQLFAHPLHPYPRALLSLTRGQMNAVSAKMNDYAETVEKTKKSTKKTALFHEKWEKTGILRRKPEGQGQSIG